MRFNNPIIINEYLGQFLKECNVVNSIKNYIGKIPPINQCEKDKTCKF